MARIREIPSSRSRVSGEEGRFARWSSRELSRKDTSVALDFRSVFIREDQEDFWTFPFEDVIVGDGRGSASFDLTVFLSTVVVVAVFSTGSSVVVSR